MGGGPNPGGGNDGFGRGEGEFQLDDDLVVGRVARTLGDGGPGVAGGTDVEFADEDERAFADVGGTLRERTGPRTFGSPSSDEPRGGSIVTYDSNFGTVGQGIREGLSGAAADSAQTFSAESEEEDSFAYLAPGVVAPDTEVGEPAEPTYSGAAATNKYILNDEEVQIKEVLENERYIYIDDETLSDTASAAIGNLSKFYFIYGLLVDIDVSEPNPKYVFRLYENFTDLELEVGALLATPPEEFSLDNGLLQDMSLFSNDLIVVGRFERLILKEDQTDYYDQEYLMYDRFQKMNRPADSFGSNLWLSPSSQTLFNYRFNLSRLGAASVLNSCIISIRDNFKIPRSQNTQYDFKFCESSAPKISGEQVITNETSPAAQDNSADTSPAGTARTATGY